MIYKRNLVSEITYFLTQAQKSKEHTQYSSALNEMIRSKIGHLHLEDQLIKLEKIFSTVIVLGNKNPISIKLDAMSSHNKFLVFKRDLYLDLDLEVQRNKITIYPIRKNLI